MKSMKKKLVALALCVMMALSIMGCSKEEATGTISNFADQAAKLLEAGGREYDKLYTAGMNEALKNSFFECTVTGAELADELSGYAPETEGYKFLKVDITVKNTFGDTIPVGNYDFYLMWNGGNDVGYMEFMEGMYPDDVELADGESLSGFLVFEVPADISDIMLMYDEIWDDDFVGNSYAISVVL